MLYDLAVVMPVYNEEACIVSVVKSWREVLSELNLNFLIIVLNDGSTDATPNELAAFNQDERIEVVNQTNSGHGPTILMRYQQAVEIAQWVFQCDSDNEMEAKHFPKLWVEREKYTALLGIRVGRTQNRHCH